MQAHVVICREIYQYFHCSLLLHRGMGQAKLKKCYLLLCLLLLELPGGLPPLLLLEEDVEGLLPPALAWPPWTPLPTLLIAAAWSAVPVGFWGVTGILTLPLTACRKDPKMKHVQQKERANGSNSTVSNLVFW